MGTKGKRIDAKTGHLSRIYFSMRFQFIDYEDNKEIKRSSNNRNGNIPVFAMSGWYLNLGHAVFVQIYVDE